MQSELQEKPSSSFQSSLLLFGLRDQKEECVALGEHSIKDQLHKPMCCHHSSLSNHRDITFYLETPYMFTFSQCFIYK